MPSVTRPRRAAGGGADAARRQVLAAVERLLAEGASFTELSIGRIADEAGMARSTFYGHFPDKSTLLVQLADEATGDLFAFARAWADREDARVEDLERTLHTLTVEHRRHAALIRAVTEVAGYEPVVERWWRGQIDAFVDVLRERQERAGRAPADASATAELVGRGAERAIAVQAEERAADGDAAFAAGLARAIWATVG